jgi:hypothetical protein
MKAFPITETWDDPSYYGMDLRDYFAAKAMQGFCANISRDLTLNIGHFTKVAYTVADAMMEARNDNQ